MTALVTGGGGFLGRYIVEQLRGRGERVRVFCRGDYPGLRELGVELVRGDLSDPEALVEACRDVGTVYHAAAIAGIWGPRESYLRTNTTGTKNLLDASRQAGVARFLLTSSPSVVFDGRSQRDADESLPYARRFLCAYPESKALAERSVLAANVPGTFVTCALRPHLIWGPRDPHLVPRLVARARTGRLRRVGAGENLVSLCYVENAAAAHLQAADALAAGAPADGRAYFINDPEPVNLWDWIDARLRQAGIEPVRKSISERSAWRAGAACEGLWRMLRLGGEPPMTRFLAAQLSQSHTYSIRAAQADWNYRPPVSTDEGLRRLEADLPRLAGR